MLQAMDKISLYINKQEFYLEVPQTIAEYDTGLMHRRTLLANHGMLFLFDPKTNSSPRMWMKNTYIPLDMLFIGPDYKIACIVKNTKPLSLELLACNTPVAAVIELNAGEADKFHLQKNMKLLGK